MEINKSYIHFSMPNIVFYRVARSVSASSNLCPFDRLTNWYYSNSPLVGVLLLRVNQRRSDIEIIADMLKVGENGAGKTEIMYSVNMSYSQIQKYLGYLVSEGFIDAIKIGNPCVNYRVTEKGQKLLSLLVGVKEMLGLENGENIGAPEQVWKPQMPLRR
jgi:predicted transcriptional regulator